MREGTAEDPISPSGPIQLRLRELSQLFNSMDPSPFHDRDLDLQAEAFIVEWARELPPATALSVVIHLDRPGTAQDQDPIAREAIHAHFRRMSQATRRQLRQLFREGRTALLIGLACLATAILAAEVFAGLIGDGATATFVRESLVIGGWVAMWRPMEVFLYDWWPIRNRRRIYDRLGVAEVRVIPGGGASGGAT